MLHEVRAQQFLYGVNRVAPIWFNPLINKHEGIYIPWVFTSSLRWLKVIYLNRGLLALLLGLIHLGLGFEVLYKYASKLHAALFSL